MKNRGGAETEFRRSLGVLEDELPLRVSVGWIDATLHAGEDLGAESLPDRGLIHHVAGWLVKIAPAGIWLALCRVVDTNAYRMNLFVPWGSLLWVAVWDKPKQFYFSPKLADVIETLPGDSYVADEVRRAIE